MIVTVGRDLVSVVETVCVIVMNLVEAAGVTLLVTVTGAGTTVHVGRLTLFLMNKDVQGAASRARAEAAQDFAAGLQQ